MSKGFTAIEVMIVIVIIGILAAIAVPNFMKFQCRNRYVEAGYSDELTDVVCSEDYDAQPNPQPPIKAETRPFTVFCGFKDGGQIKWHADRVIRDQNEAIIIEVDGQRTYVPKSSYTFCTIENKE